MVNERWNAAQPEEEGRVKTCRMKRQVDLNNTIIYIVYIQFLGMEWFMESAVLTLRLNAETKNKLDKLATATQRSKSFIAAEAISRYLEIEAWQIAEIEQAIKEADAGDFASDAQIAKLAEKYAS